MTLSLVGIVRTSAARVPSVNEVAYGFASSCQLPTTVNPLDEFVVNFDTPVFVVEIESLVTTILLIRYTLFPTDCIVP
ncbi:hypothetical protein SDC9_162132 [bioreactor metagenome]|uniref:Uncharacterized protein n=1 Tax=bioreactor metagenome TaxID=1076179 RepID=A0A645FRL6_9ZZZZ